MGDEYTPENLADDYVFVISLDGIDSLEYSGRRRVVVVGGEQILSHWRDNGNLRELMIDGMDATMRNALELVLGVGKAVAREKIGRTQGV
jgi:hypothetical protein